MRAAAIERVAEIARGYSTLEYDLARGARGRRDVHAEALLCRLTGAEAAVVVNNNAAATLIVLAALAAGREVIVSRGELVEIGGGFRVPDVMAQSGAILREVGTTNKTRAADYAAAISERTALILRVHPSNFRIEGFTERPALDGSRRASAENSTSRSPKISAAAISRQSGSDRGQTWVRPGLTLSARNRRSQASIAAGVDVCCFSGDKLLGGPQAGIIVGRTALVDRIRTHPLMRALRVDKMTYAALEATLAEYAAGRAAATIPVQRMLTMTRRRDPRARGGAGGSAQCAIAGWRAEIVAGDVRGRRRQRAGRRAADVAGRDRERRPVARTRSRTRLRALTPPVIARIERRPRCCSICGPCCPNRTPSSPHCSPAREAIIRATRDRPALDGGRFLRRTLLHAMWLALLVAASRRPRRPPRRRKTGRRRRSRRDIGRRPPHLRRAVRVVPRQRRRRRHRPEPARQRFGTRPTLDSHRRHRQQRHSRAPRCRRSPRAHRAQRAADGRLRAVARRDRRARPGPGNAQRGAARVRVERLRVVPRRRRPRRHPRPGADGDRRAPRRVLPARRDRQAGRRRIRRATSSSAPCRPAAPRSAASASTKTCSGSTSATRAATVHALQKVGARALERELEATLMPSYDSRLSAAAARRSRRVSGDAARCEMTRRR